MSDGSVTIDTKLNNSEFEKGINKLESIGQKGLKALAAGAGIAGAAVGAIGTYAIKVGSDFEAGMSKVQAISGATGDEIAKLTEKAREMGAKTKFSATESAEAFEYMAMAGWKTEDMLNGIEGIMNLAAASGENLGNVSDIVTDALTAFGLQAKDSAHFADVLAKASSNSNTNVGLMGATFKYVAPIAGSMKYSIEDTAVAIGLMANAGIKGEQAGTALRSMLTRLVKPPKDAAQALKKLNISAKNSDGTMKPLSQTLKELRAKFAKLNDSQKASYASSIAGTEAMSGMLAIVNASDSDFEKLTQAINNSDGATKEMADTMNNNLKGATTIMKSNMESLGIAIYDKFNKPATKGIKSVTKVLENLTKSASSGKLSKSIEKIADSFGKLIEKSGKIIEKVLPKLIDGFSWIIDHGGTIAGVIGGVVGAIKGFEAISKGAKLLETATTTMKNLKGVLNGTEALATGASNGMGLLTQAVGFLATPAGIATIATTGLAAAILYLATKQTEAQKKAKEFAEEMEEAKTSFEEYNQSIEKTAKANLAQINSVEKLKDELKTLVDENGKVKEGYKNRVEFILKQLNGALGTEYKLNGDIIQSYKEIQNGIDEIIKKKKAEIKLNAEQEKYTKAVETEEEAVNNLKEAHDNLGMSIGEARTKLQGLKDEVEINREGNAVDYWTQKEIEELENLISGYENAESVVKQCTENKKNYENDYALFVEGKYDEIGKTIKDTTQNWSNSSIQTIKDMIIQEKSNLDDYKKMYEDTGSEVAKQQMEQAKQNIENLANELSTRTSTLEVLGLDEIAAWKTLANNSYEAYKKEIEKMPPEMQQKIQDVTGVIVADTGLTTASTKKAIDMTTNFENKLQLGDRTKKEIDNTETVISQDTSVANASKELGEDVDTNFNNKLDGWSWGWDLVKNIYNGLTNQNSRSLISSGASILAGAVKAVIGHSVPEKGPLKDELTYMPDMIDNFVKGIEKNAFKLYDASTLLAQNIKDGLNLKDINKDGIIDVFDELAIQEQAKEVAELVKKSIKTISDVNQDGEIDVFDTLAIQEQIDEMLEMFKGDINQDGGIDVFDALAIQEKMNEITNTVKKTTETLSEETPKLYNTIDELAIQEKVEAMANMVKNTSSELNKQVPTFCNSIKSLEEALNFDNVYNKLQQTVDSMLSMVRNLTDKISNEVLKLSNTNKMLQKEIQEGLNLSDMYKKMQASVDFEIAKLSTNLSTKATLQLAKEQPKTITNDNGVTINNTQQFYSKNATPYEEQKQAKQQLRRLAYGL